MSFCALGSLYSFYGCSIFSYGLSLGDSNGHIFCLVLDHIELENSSPQAHPLRYSSLTPKPVFLWIPLCLIVTPLTFPPLMHEDLKESPIDSFSWTLHKLLRSTLYPFPESPNYRISFLFPGPSPPWTKSTFVRPSVANPVTMSLAASYELMLAWILCLVTESIHPLFVDPLSVPVYSASKVPHIVSGPSLVKEGDLDTIFHVVDILMFLCSCQFLLTVTVSNFLLSTAWSSSSLTKDFKL